MNEVKKAEDLISCGDTLGDIKSTMSLLARYDIQHCGMSPDAAYSHVLAFTQKVYPEVGRGYINARLEYYIAHAADFPLSEIDYIPITSAEMESLAVLDGIRIKCLAFTALAVSKHDAYICPDTNYWIRGDRWGELVRRANLTLTGDDTALMFHRLYVNNMIAKQNRINGSSIQVLFADTNGVGEEVMRLVDADFYDLGYRLKAYYGERFFRCEECGRWVKQAKNGRRRFCNDCAADNHAKTALKSYHRKKSWLSA